MKTCLDNLIQKAASLSAEPDILAHIDAACDRNQAATFYTEDGQGMLTLRMVWDEDGTPGIWIWLAASTGGHITPAYFAQLCKLARLAKAQFIGFRTRRPGLIRRAEKFGFIRQPDDDGLLVARYWLNGHNKIK